MPINIQDPPIAPKIDPGQVTGGVSAEFPQTNLPVSGQLDTGTAALTAEGDARIREFREEGDSLLALLEPPPLDPDVIVKALDYLREFLIADAEALTLEGSLDEIFSKTLTGLLPDGFELGSLDIGDIKNPFDSVADKLGESVSGAVQKAREQLSPGNIMDGLAEKGKRALTRLEGFLGALVFIGSIALALNALLNTGDRGRDSRGSYRGDSKHNRGRQRSKRRKQGFQPYDAKTLGDSVGESYETARELGLDPLEYTRVTNGGLDLDQSFDLLRSLLPAQGDRGSKPYNPRISNAFEKADSKVSER